jgi:DNA polymerase-1
MQRAFVSSGMDCRIVMTIHDEVLVEVREDLVDKAKEVIKYSMETAVKLDPIKLRATPIVGNSYGDCK